MYCKEFEAEIYAISKRSRDFVNYRTRTTLLGQFRDVWVESQKEVLMIKKNITPPPHTVEPRLYLDRAPPIAAKSNREINIRHGDAKMLEWAGLQCFYSHLWLQGLILFATETSPLQTSASRLWEHKPGNTSSRPPHFEGLLNNQFRPQFRL